jgi:dTDP-4-dehydrorhamnose 3,5-epimerase
MQIERLAIPEVLLLRPQKFGDHRGFFSETFRQSLFDDLGIGITFVQDNQSFSAEQGTVRGLHFQTRDFAQAKLVRVLHGAILDVAVDIRHGSPTFGRHVAVRIDAEQWNQIFIPVGFAHGFCTLEPDTEVFYKVSNYYSAEHDRGLLWSDPALGIDWPVPAGEAVLSDKDRGHPTLDRLPAWFTHRS